MSNYEGRWTTVKVEIEEGIAWVILNRPEKRNAMSPTLNREMIDVLETLEQDPDAGVLVLTGAGEAWTAGMDLKEYFREVDAGPEILQEKIRREASQWQWKLLRMYAKPTIARSARSASACSGQILARRRRRKRRTPAASAGGREP